MTDDENFSFWIEGLFLSFLLLGMPWGIIGTLFSPVMILMAVTIWAHPVAFVDWEGIGATPSIWTQLAWSSSMLAISFASWFFLWLTICAMKDSEVAR